MHVEDEKLVTQDVTKFRQAVECWFASFWVFSLQYPMKLSKTLHLIEYALVQCTATAPSSLCSWAERLGLGRNC